MAQIDQPTPAPVSLHASKRMRWRPLLSLMGVTLLVLIGANLIFSFSAAHQSQSSSLAYQGTDLGATPAPLFQLTDQNGTRIALQQFHGHPVVLTFLYTTCPGPCPLTAAKLYGAVSSLGPLAHQVDWLAVSVNPAVDTPGLATAFVAAHQLTGYLHFLLGTMSHLKPIWQNYAISVQLPKGGGAMVHSVGVYLIDAQGHERIYFDSTFTSAMLASDLRLLLREAR